MSHDHNALPHDLLLLLLGSKHQSGVNKAAIQGQYSSSTMQIVLHMSNKTATKQQ